LQQKPKGLFVVTNEVEPSLSARYGSHQTIKSFPQ
jgi:hypothetical protein